MKRLLLQICLTLALYSAGVVLFSAPPVRVRAKNPSVHTFLANGDETVTTLVDLDNGEQIEVEGGTIDDDNEGTLTLVVDGEEVPAVGDAVKVLHRGGKKELHRDDDEDDGTVRAFVWQGKSWPSGAYSWRFNTSSVPSNVVAATALTDLQASVAYWATQTGADMTPTYAGTTAVANFLNDGVNAVYFRNIQGDTSTTHAADTKYWYNGSNQLVDADVEFHYSNTYRYWTGTAGCVAGAYQYYIRNIGAHEFGHAFGFGHSTISGATMWPNVVAQCDQSWTTLAGDDIALARAAYPAVSYPEPDLTAPAIYLPTNGQTSVATTAPAYIRWYAVSGATSYDIYFGTTSATAPPKVATITSTQNVSCCVANTHYYGVTLATATTYYWKIVAKNATQVSSTAVWSFSTPGAVTVPGSLATPTAFLPLNNQTGVTTGQPPTGTNCTTCIRWNKVTGATSYDVYYGTASSPPLLGTVTPPAGASVTYADTFYIWTEARNKNTRYYWKIVAKNSSTSASSAVWTFVTAP